MTAQELRQCLIAELTTYKQGESEYLVNINNDLFEQCIVDKSDNEQRVARKRGFIRICTQPYFEQIDGLSMYRHGIVNFINTESPVNQIHSVTIQKPTVSYELALLHESARIIDIDVQQDSIVITYTQQNYVF
jgi:hypothetical protein